MADAENGQKIDPDATNVFDEEEIDDRIPCSVSYFMICKVLPVMNGLLNSFAWSAYALYARKNGWNLSLAGLAISIGCGGRLIVQQVIFRAGIWTCAIFAVVQLTVASMAIAYPAEAIVVYVQAACIPMFDVTVAIETLLPWALGVGTVPRAPGLPRGLWACWMILHERKGYLLQYPLGFAIMLGDGEPTPHIACGSSPSLKQPVSRHFPKKAWPSIPGQTQRR